MCLSSGKAEDKASLRKDFEASDHRTCAHKNGQWCAWTGQGEPARSASSTTTPHAGLPTTTPFMLPEKLDSTDDLTRKQMPTQHKFCRHCQMWNEGQTPQESVLIKEIRRDQARRRDLDEA